MQIAQFNIKQEKDILRKKFIEQRYNISAEHLEIITRKITKKFLSTFTYKECDTVLLYKPVKNELATDMLAKEVLKSGRTLAYPRCNPDNSTMEYHIINSLEELEEGAYRISEPPQSFPKVSDTKKTVCILPALAFDMKGYRLGYGKGYYDRYLNNFEGKRVGLVYSKFLVEKLPYGKYDKTVDMIITEKEVYCPHA